MIKLMFLLAGLNAPLAEVDQRDDTRPNAAEKIEIGLMEELDYFEFLEGRIEDVVVDAQIADNGGTLKCVESHIGVILMLGESVDFEYGSGKRALHRQQVDLAEFHLLQLTEVVDKAQGKLSEAEECLATHYANFN